MLLAVDIGNMIITLAVFREDKLIANFRMTTKIPRTSDEYGLVLTDLLKARGIDVLEIKSVIIASVVPNIMHSFTNAIIKYFKIKPMVVGAGTKTGIKIATSNPKEIGADRIVDLVAAYEIYGGPVIVIDFGTATTYDLVTKEGSFIAGVTSPGIKISANALWQETAKLPEIEIKKPKSILARDTISSIQAGLVYGYIGQTEYIVKRMIEESKLAEVKVVATGGVGKLIADSTEVIGFFDSNLTMKGLYHIYCRNQAAEQTSKQ